MKINMELNRFSVDIEVIDPSRNDCTGSLPETLRNVSQIMLISSSRINIIRKNSSIY